MRRYTCAIFLHLKFQKSARSDTQGDRVGRDDPISQSPDHRLAPESVFQSLPNIFRKFTRTDMSLYFSPIESFISCLCKIFELDLYD